jgi:hypothetical protein
MWMEEEVDSPGRYNRRVQLCEATCRDGDRMML